MRSDIGGFRLGRLEFEECGEKDAFKLPARRQAHQERAIDFPEVWA